MSTQWGHDPYGSGNDPYSIGNDSYGSGNDPYGSGSDAYDPGREPTGASGDPYSSQAAGHDPYGASSSDGALHGPGYSSSFAQHGGLQFGAGAQGPYAYPVAMAPPSSGLGIAGFVLGILSLVFCGGLTAPFGLVLSIMGMKETAPGATPPKSGRGLAIAGLVLSILGTLVLLAVVAYFVLMIVLVGATAGSEY